MVDLPQTTSADDALWQSIRHEIVERARLEPVLASFFHAAVLSHKSLEDALAYNLAEQLGNSILSPLAIHQVLLEAMQRDSSICERMRLDLRAHMERDPACGQYCLPLLYFKGFHALQVYRVANWLWRHQRRSLALFLQSRASEIFAVDIHPAAEIAGGIMLDHATGLVIGETAVIGENVSLLHSVTLGGTGAQAGDRHPKIRCGVLIAAGAKVLGNIEVGEGAKIGAGSLVLDSVLPHTTVVGVPARVVGVPGEAEPSRTMDQRINLGCG